MCVWRDKTKQTVTSSHQYVMGGQRGRNGSCCVPRDQEDQAVLVFILINGRVRIKRSRGSNFCPLGFARSWECAFALTLIQQLKKRFCTNFWGDLLFCTNYTKWESHQLLFSADDVIRVLPWWIINCFFTVPVRFDHPMHIWYKTGKNLWKTYVPGTIAGIYKKILCKYRQCLQTGL